MQTRWRIPPDSCARIRRREVGQADHPEHVPDAKLALVLAERGAAQAERDIRGDVEPRQRRVVLKHDADAVGRLAGDRPSFEVDRTLRRDGEAGDQLEQRRLAAARRTDDREELAAAKLEIERAERAQRCGRLARHEHLADAVQPDLRVRHGFPCLRC